MSDTTEKDNHQQQPEQNNEPATSQGNNEGEPSFTQAELDRIVGERAKRAKDVAVKEILEKLGASDVDSLTTLVEEARKRKEAEMSEAEKAQALVEKERARAKQLEDELKQLKASQIAQRRDSAFKTALRNAGATNEDDLAILVNAKMSDQLLKVFDDSGNADDGLMEAFIKDVQSKYDNYFATSGAGSPSKSGGTPPSNRAHAIEQAKEEIKRRHGKI